jgi:hypothetical protein
MNRKMHGAVSWSSFRMRPSHLGPALSGGHSSLVMKISQIVLKRKSAAAVSFRDSSLHENTIAKTNALWNVETRIGGMSPPKVLHR